MIKNTSELQCPLCGENNQCSVAMGKPAEDCWCVAATIDAAQLKAIPEADQGKRCICPACAEASPKVGNKEENISER